MKKFPTVGIEKWQNMLPREAVESTSSEVFRKEKGKYLLFMYFSTGRVYLAQRQGDERGASRATPIPVISRARSRLKHLVPSYSLSYQCIPSGAQPCTGHCPNLQRLSPTATMNKGITFRGKSIQLHRGICLQGERRGHGPVSCKDIA